MFNPAHQLLYAQAIDRGRRGQFWSALTGCSRELLGLQQAGVTVAQAPAAGGTRVVPLSQIRGSESRSADFDRDFNPLQSHTRERWLGIAAARQRGRRLPPVALIQVDDVFFVRDGHHRISVAQALGCATVEATVEVWKTDGSLSHEMPGPAVAYRRKTEQLLRKVQDDLHALMAFFTQRVVLRSRQGHV
jgi:hypothetical protein